MLDQGTLLDSGSSCRLQTIFSENIGNNFLTKGVLVQNLKMFLSPLDSCQIFIVGGSAQQILFDHPKNDFDVAIFSPYRERDFPALLAWLIPYLVSCGFQESDIRINHKFQMVSFADVDIKFPHPAKRSHLFDADAVGVDITNDGMCCMKLLPGYIKSISLEHALACNNCKHLILSDPDHAESYALRAILKCTQGWHAPHELIERSVGALVLEDLATFEWNLFQFLRGHGHQERVLFLMNLRNLLTRHSASRDMIGIIERNFFGDGVPLLDMEQEMHSYLLASLGESSHYDSVYKKFINGPCQFFLASPLEVTLLEILRKRPHFHKHIFETLCHWSQRVFLHQDNLSAVSEFNLNRRDFLKNKLLPLLQGAEFGQIRQALDHFLEEQEELGRLENFKRLPLEGQLCQILLEGGISGKEYKIISPRLETLLDGLSLKDLLRLGQFKCFENDKEKFFSKLIRTEQLSLVEILENLKSLGCQDPALYLIEHLESNSHLAPLLRANLREEAPLNRVESLFWDLALKDSRILSLLGLEGLVLDPFCLELFIPFIADPQPSRVQNYLEQTKGEWLAKIADLDINQVDSSILESVFPYFNGFSPTVTAKFKLGFIIPKIQEWILGIRKDPVLAQHQIRSFPTQLHPFLQRTLENSAFSSKEIFFENLVNTKKSFDDGRYFYLIASHYPKGLDQGYMEYALKISSNMMQNPKKNPNYLAFLRGVYKSSQGPLKDVLLGRLVLQEDFDRECDPEVFLEGLKLKKVPSQKVQIHYAALLEIGDLQSLDGELLKPLTDENFLEMIPVESALKLVTNILPVSREDLSFKVDFLIKHGKTDLIPELISKGGERGLYTTQKLLAVCKPFFSSTKEWLESFDLREIDKRNSSVDLVCMDLFLENFESLSVEMRKLLTGQLANALPHISPSKGPQIASLLLSNQTVNLDWDVVTTRFLENNYLNYLEQPQMGELLRLFLRKNNSKSAQYDRIRDLLIETAPRDHDLEFMGNKEMIRLFKFQPEMLEPFISLRIRMGRFCPSEIQEINRNGVVTPYLIEAFLDSLEKNRDDSPLFKEIAWLLLSHGAAPEELLIEGSFLDTLSDDEAKKHRDELSKILSDDPRAIDHYLRWIQQALQRKDIDRGWIRDMAQRAFDLNAGSKEWDAFKKTVLSSPVLPSSVLFLTVHLARKMRDKECMVRCLLDLKDNELFPCHFRENIWAIDLLLAQDSIDYKDQISVQVVDLIRHFWRVSAFQTEAPGINIVNYLPFFPPDAVEHSFVNCLTHIEFFRTQVEANKPLDEDTLLDFKRFLEELVKPNGSEPRCEVLFPILDEITNLFETMMETNKEENPAGNQIRAFFLANSSLFGVVVGDLVKDLSKMGKAPQFEGLSLEVMKRYHFILMMLTVAITDPNNNVEPIFSILDFPIYMTDRLEKSILYMHLYILLGKRFHRASLLKDPSFKDPEQVSLLPTILRAFVCDLIDRDFVDRRGFGEIIFLKDAIFENFSEIPNQTRMGALDILTSYLEHCHKKNPGFLQKDFSEKISEFKRLNVLFRDILLGDEYKMIASRWIEVLNKLLPRDPEILEFSKEFLESNRAQALLNTFDSSKPEEKFGSLLQEMPIGQRGDFIESLLEEIKGRSASIDVKTPYSKGNILALKFLIKSLLSREFRSFLGLDQSQNPKKIATLSYKILHFLGNETYSYDVAEVFTDPEIDLNQLVALFLSVQEGDLPQREMVLELFNPLVESFKIVFSPSRYGSKKEMQKRIPEPEKKRRALHWIGKFSELERLLFNDPKLRLTKYHKDLIEIIKMQVYAQSDFKMEEIKLILLPFFNCQKTLLLTQIAAAKSGLPVSSEDKSFKKLCADVVLETYKYIGSFPPPFTMDVHRDIKEIKTFYLS
jgi:hypothetical protein